MYSITLLTKNGSHITIVDKRGKVYVREQVASLNESFIPLYACETDNETKERYYVPQSRLFYEYEISWDKLMEFLDRLESTFTIKNRIVRMMKNYSCYHGQLSATERMILSELAFEVFTYTYDDFIVVPSRYIREKGYFNE